MPDKVSPSANSTKAVILAGGSGTRLWPLSRLHLPKQFLKLNGEHTLLEETIQRLYPLIDSGDTLVVTGAEHATGEAYSALKPYTTLLEPAGRNTAPAIALAAAWLQQQERAAGRDIDIVMVVLPADHVIRAPEAFHSALSQAIEAAVKGHLITFGITPERPVTGFGYIKADGHESPLMVERFAEKPDAATAKQFMSGGYYWNAGIFVWRTRVILDAIRHHLPDVAAVLERIITAWGNDAPSQAAVEQHFRDMPDISIDYGVLEKSDNIALVPCDIGWSDVGCWDSVHEIAELDNHGNALQGRPIAIDCKNSLIYANQRLVAAVGVRDLCVVETADAVLIIPRGQTQRVREVVDTLQDRNSTEHILHRTVQRPWGSYTVLEEHNGYKMKRITVQPGASLSLQRHQHRSEHWVVVSGTASVVRGEEQITVSKNQSTYIPIGVKHRLENRGRIPLQLIEVQVGEYLEEDDIERFDDHYGR
ncbi:MAG: mannose-1-phosphate guanylyltransferase/mannose-6-phosphate isomerase [Pseudomonadota bacterium]